MDGVLPSSFEVRFYFSFLSSHFPQAKQEIMVEKDI